MSSDAEGNADRFDLEIEKYRRSYEATGNPLYVWAALREILGMQEVFYPEQHLHTAFLNACRAADGLDQVEPSTYTPNPAPQISIPLWCAEYLAQCADRLFEASNQRDWSAPLPTPGPGAFTKWWETKTSSFAQSVESAAALFGLSRRGWNAFKSKDNDTQIVVGTLIIDSARHGGTDRAKALAFASKFFSVEDDRTLRRTIKTGRKLLGPIKHK